jgi:hypothetical protein
MVFRKTRDFAVVLVILVLHCGEFLTADSGALSGNGALWSYKNVISPFLQIVFSRRPFRPKYRQSRLIPPVNSAEHLAQQLGKTRFDSLR